MHSGRVESRSSYSCLEGRQVRGEEAEEIVGFPEEPVRLDDVRRASATAVSNAFEGLALRAAHRDEDDGLEAESDHLGVELGRGAGDGAGSLEGLGAVGGTVTR